MKHLYPLFLFLALLILPIPLDASGLAGRKSLPFNRPTADPVAAAVQSCINGSHTLTPTQARVAWLRPTFTLTPYGNYGSSFYGFYGKYEHMKPGVEIRTDLNWLRTQVKLKWSVNEFNGEKPLYDFLTSVTASRCGLSVGRNLQTIDDIAVDKGALFAGNGRQFDVLVLGHEEYVTRAEYEQLKHFVAAGGRLVEMSGNTFWAEVTYDPYTGIETFVGGHGFQFNGVYAWRSDYRPFDNDAAGWFGSTFAAYENTKVGGAWVNETTSLGRGLKSFSDNGHVFTTYGHPSNEANYVRNFTSTEIIATFYSHTHVYIQDGKERIQRPLFPVYSYEHQYGKGQVFCLCIYGEDLIGHDRGAQFFQVYAIINGFGGGSVWKLR